MAPTEDTPRENPVEDSPDAAEFDALDGELQKGLDADPRLDSGVPEHLRAADLDFIQMSGLTTPAANQADAAASERDVDTSRPLSFYERGVADVDASMAPGLAEDQETSDPAISSEASELTNIAHLRDIIADLSQEDKKPAAPVVEVTEVEVTVPAEAEVTVTVESTQIAPEFVAAKAVPAAELEKVTPTPVHVAPHPASIVPNLAAAEELLQALEQTPEPTTSLHSAVKTAGPAHRPMESDRPQRPALRPLTMRDAGDDDPPPRVDPNARRRSRGRAKATSAWRFVLAVAAVLMIAVAGYEAYQVMGTRLGGPLRLYHQAQTAANAGRFEEASDLFDRFAVGYPEHPLHADAQFNAGFTLQRATPSNSDEMTVLYAKAQELLEQFCENNPTHPKVARTRILIGRLQYETGAFQKTIETLQDPELRLKDPVGAVPALRTLARAYAKLGQADSSRSYYLQSVGTQDNHTPDVDFAELGDLYLAMAERAEGEEQTRFESLAMEQWTQATQVAGIDAGSKKSLRTKVDVMREQQSRRGTPTVSEPTAAVSPVAAPEATGTPSSWDAEPTFETPVEKEHVAEAHAAPAPDQTATEVTHP